MSKLTDSPFVMLVISFITLWLCAWLGAEVLGKYATRRQEQREDFGTVLAACLTLLGLIIGFSFSMAVNRYDLRNSSEAAEATAIGTEYARADFLLPADAVKTRLLLKSYLAQRIEFFDVRDAERLRHLDEQTTQMQRQLWSLVQATASQRPNGLTTLTVSGMNDVINSQGNTQAAWWNRIPKEAWVLMGLIAILCNGMLGFVTGRDKGRGVLIVLPVAISVAFFLIADIDSPSGGGMIHVAPQNLLNLARHMG